MIRFAFFAAIALAVVQASAQEKPLRVYFVGNSVTDTINYRALAELSKSRGHDHVWGRHMIPGAPLQWIWQHPKDGFQEPPFGHYPNALTNFHWDVLSLQPFDRHLDGKDGDLVMAKNFIDLALPKSPGLQVFVYARWPRQQKGDFDTAWLKKYTGGWDNTNESRDYFERLTLELRKAYPKLTIRMVPVGHVMYEMNQRMKAGEVSGYKQIKEVFADGIHLNNVGSYVVGCTFFATLYKENPKGLPGEPYKVTDPKLAEVIQETVWKVVSTNELAGVDGSKKATAIAPITVEAFLKIKSLVLTKGDRQTYCDMYNDNPHYGFKDFDVFLDPDTGQGNINCDKQKSDFNYMVFRTETSGYFDLRLNASKPSERHVEILHGAKEAEVAPLFSSALAECDRHTQSSVTLDIKTQKAEDRVTATVEKDMAIFDATSRSGIGGATITTKGMWPTTVILRFHLRGLELFSISNGKVKLSGSVLSHSENPRLLHVEEDGKEKKVEKDSQYWTEIQGFDSKGGYFEIAVPKALLEGQSKSLELGWIDFYRG